MEGGGEGGVEGEAKMREGGEIWCSGRRFRLSGRPFSVAWPTCTHAKVSQTTMGWMA